MGDRSAIEWTDATWNPIRALYSRPDGPKLGWHCEHISPGCRNCYAESLNKWVGTGFAYKPGHLQRPGRFHREVLGDVSVFLDETMLLLPMTRKWAAPRMIFVGSMTDIAADFVTDEMLDRIFATMAVTPQHTYQVLTKRIERLRRWFEAYTARKKGIRAAYDAMGYSEVWLPEWPLPNVWIGTSIEDRAALLERAGHLRKTPAAVRFFSCEPLLGDLGDVVLSDIDWVICGGESGPNARPMHPDWARSLRDQCAAAGVPFFFKQWGEWAPQGSDAEYEAHGTERTVFFTHHDHAYAKVGKKKAGRLLDGVEHNAMPQAQHA